MHFHSDDSGTIYLKKCGEVWLESAGDCFSQAECWPLAAEAYGKRNKYSKCLSACSKDNLLEMGLNFIQRWKENATADDPVAKDQSLHEITDPFVERCIFHYRRMKNKDHTLKAIRAFSCVENARTFLKSQNYLDELFMMEEELGNFLEAANIAKLKGDLVLEARMLAKTGDNEHAARLIHFHVVVNSLWSSGGKGWPLKQFREKDELLRRAEILSQKHSSHFYESVCVQSGILSDKKGCLLDLISSTSENHSRTTLLNNAISCETTRENDYSSYIDFCLEYFGVRKVGDERYNVIIADASWIKEFDVRPLNRISGCTYIQESQFLSAAKCYWASELVAVGMKVLEMIEALDKFCFEKNNPLFCQGTIILHIYEVSKFLIESELVGSKLHKKQLQNFFELSKGRFFEIVFPLDWRQTATLNMFSLRQRDLAVELLREILPVNISVRDHKLSFGQIGRIVMLLFTCGMPGEELYLIIHQHFGVACPPWGTFLENLWQNKGPEQQVLMTMALQDALQSTFHAGWQSESNDVAWKLPRAFYDCFKNVRRHNFAEMFARALKAIEDPLVTVSFKGKCRKLSPAHSIFIDIGAAESREDILDVLMPRKNAGCKSEPLGNSADGPCVADLPSSGSLEGSGSHSGDPSGRAKESKVIENDDCIPHRVKVGESPAETSASVPSTQGQGDKGKPNKAPRKGNRKGGKGKQKRK
ncbi:hypothetical protein Taro_035268 [Colocasia esculenta]|uniref:Uncharacterized protein n=1 Tax=Colocasia esculenta TaxID=4460 RepID=A0A843WI42_COLES|nr:hypothetical protein [Colocasia esculenta]